MKIIAVTFLFFISTLTLAQVSSTEIHLVDIAVKKNKKVYGVPLNITNHEGYDNQPSFSPDSKRILYVSMPDTTQSDIYQYTIADSSVKRLCETTESEFSPRYAPNEQFISIVKVNPLKAQNFCSLGTGGKESEVIAEGLDSIGYYCWINDSIVAFASLNNGMELFIYELANQQFIIAEKGIGRCLMRDPKSGNIIFTRKQDGKVNLYTYNLQDGEITFFCHGYGDVEDYVFADANTLLAGFEGKLYSTNPLAGKDWKQEADFTKHLQNFYRMAVSPDGKKLALVSFSGKRP
jgi:hypothetical protein